MRSPLPPIRAACLLALIALAACDEAREVPADAGRPDASPDAPQLVDLDRDGHPAGSDCDDHDAARWQSFVYSYRDVDGDQRTVPSAGTLCAGTALPAGYYTGTMGLDCDDANPAVFEARTGYVDSDGDLFGDGAAVSLCTGAALPAGYAPVAGDCAPADAAAWATRAYAFRDVDGDGAAVASSGSLCTGAALPVGYLAAPPPGRELDCDDGDAAIFLELTGYLDADGDQVGAGSAMLVCTAGTLPASHAATTGDCAPADSTAWILRAYSYRDADGDGRAILSSGQVCSGAALPASYLTSAPPGGSSDCDDANAALFINLTVYADGDADGFGAGAGQLVCTGGTPPAGTSLLGADCDDANAATWMSLVYRAIDADADGFTTPASGTRCTAGFLPLPYYAAAIGNDCDDTDAALTRFGVLYPDGDSDGVGASPRQVRCLGTAIPSGFSTRGYDEDDADPAVIESEDSDELLEIVLS